ncbi:hypothetical protein Ocin01_00296 [Orchesella cincta]|uniref:Transmembrane protein n=1 Tax=Orchesella cincta TaxID=48709 RepID=A0A1D2NMC0_ORCCI|nr:hypothetical protein Ocin01_00296 [Orchesella cincta]
MGCRSLLEAALELAKSMLVLTAATLYRCIIFMVYLSASIGPTTLITHLYQYCTGLEPLTPFMQTAICMLFVSLWAEFSVGSEKRIFGDAMQRYKDKYPATMNFGRFTVHFVLYTLAFFQLYIQFEATHTFQPTPPIPKPAKSGWLSELQNWLIDFDEESLQLNSSYSSKQIAEIVETLKTQEMHMLLFKLSMSYLVFITARNLHRAVLLSIKDLPYNAFFAFNNCIIRLGFAILNLCANALYFVPCMALSYSIRSYKYSGTSTYFQLCFVAALSGMVSSLFEMNRPWPQEHGQLPFLYLENNMMSKNIVAHGNVVCILIAYYRPFQHTKTPAHMFDSSNPDVIWFCMSVAFTVLHITKYGTHAVLSMTEDPSLHRLEVVAADVLDNYSGSFNNDDDSPDLSNTNTNAVYNPCTAPLNTTGERSEQNHQNNINNNNNAIESDSAPPANEQRAEPKETGGHALFNLSSKSDLLRALKVIEQAVLLQDTASSSPVAIKGSTESTTNTDINKNDTVLVVEFDGLSSSIVNDNDKSNEAQSSVHQDIESGIVIMQTPVQQQQQQPE